MKKLAVGVVCLLMVAGVAQPLVAADTIKIGAILSVTGPFTLLGGPEAKTIQMLVDETNKAGGVLGRKVELILKDTQGNADKAVEFTRQLIEENGVLAIIGPSSSGESLKVKSVAEENQTILISCASNQGIVDPVAKWVFKTPQKDADVITPLFNTMKSMGITKIALVASNSGFGQGGMKTVQTMAPDAGLTILGSETYDQAATDMTGVLTKLQALKPQGVVNWSVEPAQSIVAKNMKQIGFNVPLFQSHGFGNIKYVQVAGKAADGIIFPCGRLLEADLLPASNPQKAVLTNYKKGYESTFNEDVSTFGGHAWDAYEIIMAAIKKANSTDKNKVRDAIENLTGFVGIAGVFNFSPTDHCGIGMDTIVMYTVKDGKFVPYAK